MDERSCLHYRAVTNDLKASDCKGSGRVQVIMQNRYQMTSVILDTDIFKMLS